MAARLVEVSVPALASLPGDVLAAGALLVASPVLAALIVALAVLAAARRLTPTPERVEPQVTEVDPLHAAYDAVRDWYAVSGDSAAEMMYLALAKRTGRND